jgi:hypothetical protein
MVTTSIVLIVVLAPTYYFTFYRNNKVHVFRKYIIDMAYTGDNWPDKSDIYRNGPSYNKMIFSFKPFKLESFYTPEEIEILTK